MSLILLSRTFIVESYLTWKGGGCRIKRQLQTYIPWVSLQTGHLVLETVSCCKCYGCSVDLLQDQNQMFQAEHLDCVTEFCASLSFSCCLWPVMSGCIQSTSGGILRSFHSSIVCLHTILRKALRKHFILIIL